MTSSGSARLHGSAALAALGLLAALAVRRPELAILAAPFVALVVTGLRLERPPEVRVALELERDRAVEGDEVTALLSLRSAHALDRLELVLVLPDGLESAEDENPAAVTLRPDEEREVELTIRCARWGSHALGELRLRASDRFGLVVTEWRVDRPAHLRVYPRPELVALDAQADQDAGLCGERGRTRERRRARVRRHPSIRARRPAPLGQLACERASLDADRERLPSRAEHGRPALPRQLRRGPCRRTRHARRRGAGDRDARDEVPRTPRPGRPRHVRRDPALARAEHGRDAALAPDRRAAGDRRRAQLRLEGRERDPGARALAAGPRRRDHAAPGHALGHGAARPARPRLRPRDRRGLSRAVRRTRARATSTGSRTASGCSGAPRSAPATSASASPSPAGTTRRPSPPHWRG